MEPSCAQGQQSVPTDRGHLHCQPLGLKALGGPYCWQTRREVQDSTVVTHLSCKYTTKKNVLQ